MLNYIDKDGFITEEFKEDLYWLDKEYENYKYSIVIKLYQYIKDSFTKITVISSL